MKKIIPFIAICFLFCCFSCNQNNEELLFVIVAKDASIKKQDNNTYTLTLKGTHKTVTYFTDRPQRKAGKILLEKFMGNWSKMFKDDPPNAAYVFYSTNDNPFSEITAELTNPKYDYHNDMLTFTIKALKNSEIEEKDLGETALFIDRSSGSGLIGIETPTI